MEEVMRTGSSTGLCVVGLGSISAYHLNAIQQIEGIHLAAVVSRSLEKGGQVAEKYGAGHYYQKLDDALLDPDVQGVVLCTPTQAHYQEAILCATRGRHLLVEKPITECYAQAYELAQAVAAQGVVAMAGQVSRFLEPYARCRDIIATGGMGRPLQGIERRLMHRSSFASWYSGGQGHLINHWGSHPIDLFQWLFDSPAARVYCHATANIPEVGGEDDVVLSMELASDAVGSYQHSYHARRFDMSLLLIGTGGSLQTIWDAPPGSKGKSEVMSGSYDETGARVHLFRDDQPVFEGDIEAVSDAAFVAQMREFATAIRDGREPRPSVADTLVTMAVVDAARTAAREHRMVDIGVGRSAGGEYLATPAPLSQGAYRSEGS
jgi:predicted dehydrogenase